jgi:hypothetical protein
VSLDYDRHREYLDSDEHRAEDLFENPPPSATAIPTTPINPSVPSILRYFLDGSRRTYKMADLLFRGRYLPLIAEAKHEGTLMKISTLQDEGIVIKTSYATTSKTGCAGSSSSHHGPWD